MRSKSTRILGSLMIVALGLSLAAPAYVQAQESLPTDSLRAAQDHHPADVQFQRLSIRDGLSQKDVYAVFQDRQGFMWLGTRFGLNRYDGYTFSVHRNAPFEEASLSDNWILAIHEDSVGALWVGTLRGLNRIDPATGHVDRYLHDPKDAHSLSHDLVWAVYVDSAGTVWIGTEGGLSRLDRVEGRFTRYHHDAEDPYSLSSNRVYALHEDRRGRLWVSTSNGLNRFDRATGRFTRYLHRQEPPREQRADILYGIAAQPAARPHVIRSLCNDATDPDVLWVSTEHGLVRLDARSGHYRRFLPDPDDPESNVVMAVVRDPVAADVLWLTTNGGGLYRFDTRTRRFEPHRYDPHVPTSIGADKLGPLYVDRTGVIWTGSFGHGVSRFHPSRGAFVWYRHVPGEPNSLSHADVWTVQEDQTGALWIGTNAGLNRLDRETGRFTHFHHDPRNPASLSSSNINYLYEDRDGTLWVATYGGGLNRFERSTGRFVHYRYGRANPTSLGSDYVSALFEDRQGTFWVGTWGAGLHDFDRARGRFTRYRHEPENPSSLSDDRILDIYEDAAGRLWVGTYHGLNRFDRTSGRFQRFQYDIADEAGLSHPGVYSIHERRREPGVLWLATAGGGLNRLDTRTGAVTHFTEQDGLSNNRVLSILEDGMGRLWLGTADGLSRFDPESRAFHNFTIASGLQVQEFNPLAYFRSRSGEMFFGGIGGLHAFFPNRILENRTPPSVVLAGLRLFNQPVAVEAGSVLSKPLSQAEEVRIGHRDKMLTFEFVALHYLQPEANEYAYRLVGFDDDWVMAGPRRSATYTNLPAGEYVFRVRAANSDGVWNDEGASVRLVVLPPFWKTTWFYGSFLIGLLAIAYVGYRLRVGQLKTQARALEAVVAERTGALRAEKQKTEAQARRLVEIDEAKNRFFANVSHEFRTPLTLILGLIDDLLACDKESGGPDLHESLGRVRGSAHRLLRLVNQLLDLAKIESGPVEIHRRPGDLVRFLRELVDAFAPLAERRRIHLEFQTELPAQPLNYDAEKLEKVFGNLLSNALKFTPEGGKVWVTLGTGTVGDERVVEAVVKDTGSGIPREALSRIFDRFEQVANGRKFPQAGSGIGLALAKELVERHGGRILVESEPGFGSSFIVRLPLDTPPSVRPDRVADADESERAPWPALSETASVAEAAVLSATSPSAEPSRPAVPDAQKPTLVVVDDHAEVRAFLRRHLETSYNVLEAADGEDGLEMARAARPDLVLSDVMMPGMDGYALCRALKADERLRTIPVILLTARAGEQETVDGLSAGADDYIVKPFSMKELQARVDAMIRARRQAQREFSRQIVVQPSGITVQSDDEAFLERVIALVETRLDDDTFNVEGMADALGLSRRQLERRLADTLGETPAALLRRMRLERARQLLQAHSGTIAEVAYAVGFKSPAHFSKAFRKAFGVSPSEHSENAS